MDQPLDLYRVLQVDPCADLDVIRAAYRVLALRFHPDRHGGDAIMRRLNAAWEVLADPERRAAYNRSRTDLDRSTSAPSGASSAGSSPPGAATVAPARASTASAPAADHAGPPVGSPSGTVLTYGRYEGWSVGQIAAHDPNFLEWLQSVPGGRSLRAEIDAALCEARTPRRAWVRGAGAPASTGRPAPVAGRR